MRIKLSALMASELEFFLYEQTYRDAFLREGFEVWWDATLRSGEAYDEVTEGALRGAKAVVVLWSPRSVALD